MDPSAFPVARLGQALTQEQRDAHERLAVQIAAGLLIEYRDHGEPGLTEGGLADLCSLAEVANFLGLISVPAGELANLAEWPAFEPWMRERMGEAAVVLDEDGGAAWDRVRFALERRRHLSGDQVRALVAHGQGAA